MKILIIDDDIDSTEALETFLKAIGHEVHNEIDLDQGLREFVMFEPDFVFLDLVFPGNGKNGADILQEMKKINKNIPVAIITGYEDAEKVFDLFQKGALDCVFKPFNFDYIRNLIVSAKK
jgi:two-component system response regulator (stage 0 sporulation protein F)